MTLDTANGWRLWLSGAKPIDLASKIVYRDASQADISAYLEDYGKAIHGVKGTEFDCVIAFALLEGMVPDFADPNALDSAKQLLYVIASRPRKNLHLIAEVGRLDRRGEPYETTNVLAEHVFGYDLVDAAE